LGADAAETRNVTAGTLITILIRIWYGGLGVIVLVHSMLGRGTYRWGPYDFEDGSDIPIDRRAGRIWEAVVGVAFIVGATLIGSSRWLEWW